MSSDLSKDTIEYPHRNLIAEARAQVESVRSGTLPGRGDDLPSSAAPPFATPFKPPEGYDVLREIHRGGQGVVYQAVQRSTRRKVAIKVLRDGALAAPQDRVRFEREAYLLGRLRHPNIVAVHDSGCLGGHAWLTMDYISGQPIDAFAREHELSPRGVVDLMLPVCDAVAYAHLRGVVHRDLKPSNIRVDETGKAHVLDFGLAKTTLADLAGEGPGGEMTVTGQFVGSLPWASPEQAQGRATELDLRTDVYSLGVVLYQLLTGRFPYDVTTDAATVIQNILHTPPARPRTLRREIDGELEIIVLTCLRKEPDRRYQSAAEVAADLRRYLAGEPLAARRDSAAYLLRKIVRRYRVPAALLAGYVVLLTLCAVLLLGLWQRTAADLAIEEQTGSFLQQALGAAALEEATGGSIPLDVQLERVADVADVELVDRPRVQAGVYHALGTLYLNVGRFPEAVRRLSAARDLRREALGEDDPRTIETRLWLARALHQSAQYDEAEAHYRAVLAYRTDHDGPDSPEAADVMRSLAWLLKDTGRLDEAESLYRAALEIQQRQRPQPRVELARTMNDLAQLLLARRDWDTAEGYFRDALDLLERVDGPHELLRATVMANLGSLLNRDGRYAEAEALLRSALEARRTRLGPHHATVVSMNKLGVFLDEVGQYGEAESLLREALRERRALLGDDHDFVAVSQFNLGLALLHLGRYEEAEALFREAARRWEEIFANPEHGHVATAKLYLADALREQGRFAEAGEFAAEGERIRRLRAEDGGEGGLALPLLVRGRIALDQGDTGTAEPLLREALAIRRRTLLADHWRIGEVEIPLGRCLAQRGASDPALLDEARALLEQGRARVAAVKGDGDRLVLEADEAIAALDAFVDGSESEPTEAGP